MVPLTDGDLCLPRLHLRSERGVPVKCAKGVIVDLLSALVVDDEVALASVVGSYLERSGYNVVIAHDGPAAVDLARTALPDLIVLDLMLPGFDGLEVCRQVRQFSDCYIIMLTAREDEVDKVLGLSMGADDYVVKPFSPRELIARVAAMMRRPRLSVLAEAKDTISIGSLSINLDAVTVQVDGHEVDLTRTEFDLLCALATRPKSALSRGQIIEAVWGLGWIGDHHVVDVHIGHLRRKLNDDAASPRFIRTIRGHGYAMGSG